MSNVIEALNTGWIVLNVATVLAHGQNDEGCGFLVRLMEPRNHMSREVYLPYSPETEVLLNQASMPLAA